MTVLYFYASVLRALSARVSAPASVLSATTLKVMRARSPGKLETRAPEKDNVTSTLSVLHLSAVFVNARKVIFSISL